MGVYDPEHKIYGLLQQVILVVSLPSLLNWTIHPPWGFISVRYYFMTKIIQSFIIYPEPNTHNNFGYFLVQNRNSYILKRTFPLNWSTWISFSLRFTIIISGFAWRQKTEEKKPLRLLVLFLFVRTWKICLW